MNRSRPIAVATVVLAVLAVLPWKVVEGMRASMRLSFADEQTEMFSEMVEKASKAVLREPPDVKAAVGFLEYAHGYYPSGTKQIAGSRLDKIVERSRTVAERRIMEKLQAVTSTDLGTDVEAWIREFGSQAVSLK